MMHSRVISVFFNSVSSSCFFTSGQLFTHLYTLPHNLDIHCPDQRKTIILTTITREKSSVSATICPSVFTSSAHFPS
ncbi:predicted protein [Plenodomus lingam JN3]|uniref:Predicted protein n=1 Tax=Leptosphaeria maculans (strain JN3 / isolate v23.1.3 / race Av1-4-5-6-7-8) TaxID=985895 RepID=E4ZR45_LEPMJ|nr:predicted protein [Plenodomus lingam JN3]CBX93710.1 predicted protein [Plenodomus lingam JN3]